MLINRRFRLLVYAIGILSLVNFFLVNIAIHIARASLSHLVEFSGIITKTNDLQGEVNRNGITIDSELIGRISELEKTVETMNEDYPPKKSLGERALFKQ